MKAAGTSGFAQRTTTEIHHVRRHDRLGGLINEYQQVA
jgi:hypothetical protein